MTIRMGLFVQRIMVVLWAGALLGAGNSEAIAEEQGEVAPMGPCCEYLTRPWGVDVCAPRLSWKLFSEKRGERQTAYQIIVSDDAGLVRDGVGNLWDTGKVDSDANLQIPYAGKALASRMICHWRVRVWDSTGKVSAWSEPEWWTMGLLEPDDWSAEWIGQPAETMPKEGEAPGPLFRKEFTLPAKPMRATVYAATMGYSELYVNGEHIDGGVCWPPAADYDKRAYYVTHDVSSRVREGVNCIGVWLGRGWYCEGFPGVTHPGPITRVQLEITLDNGETVRIASGGDWKTHPGPVTAIGRVTSGNLDGECYDARAEVPGWNAPGLDEVEWVNAAVVHPPVKMLCSPMMQPNRVVEAYAAASVEEIAPGEYLFDLGRNVTGMVNLRAVGEAGKPIHVDLYERKDAKTGEWVAYDQQAVFIPASGESRSYSNTFNYHALRYGHVKGLAKAPVPGDFRVEQVRTGFSEEGSFTCSNELFNRIYQTTNYTYECVCAGGTTVDCPHRERLGYGGDGQITSRHALYAFDVAPLYTKWLGNWRDVQNPETGELPNIAPYPNPAGGGPTWGAICIFLPWDMYLHYGDTRVLRDNYDMMKRYVAFLDSKSADDQLMPYGNPQYGFLGDWVAPGRDQDIGPWSPEDWRTFFNNCFYAHIADGVAKVAVVLGETQDAARYSAQAARIRLATHKNYFVPAEGTYKSGGQAGLAFALLSGVTPEADRPAVIKNLERDIIETHQGHLDTGMHGTMFLLRCLNEIGRDDLAALIMNQTTYPGWGYMLEQGATTFWERWDGEMSQIHSTLLAAGEWFPRVIGGIKPDPEHPGFKRVIIDPRPVPGVDWAETRYDTIRGSVVTEWRREGGTLTLNVVLPANTTGLVRLPAAEEPGVPEGARLVKFEAGIAEFEIESGPYTFESKMATE